MATAAERFDSVVPAKEFSRKMRAFALGVQYVANKYPDINVERFELSGDLEKYGFKSRAFNAAAVGQGGDAIIVINPAMLLNINKDFNQLRKAMPDTKVTLSHDEMITLIGVEEMLHARQLQLGVKPTYDIDDFDKEAYRADPAEMETRQLQLQAIKDLGLGQKRGTRR